MAGGEPDSRPEIAFGDRTAFLPDSGALVLADLHVGRAAASNVEFPIPERADLTERLAAELDRFQPATVVVAGDLLHSFAGVPFGVTETVTELADLVADSSADLVVVPGNHDGMLDAIRKALPEDSPGFGVVEEVELDDDTVVCHGHEPPEASADRYVIGHEHPAIRIEGRRRHCFLRGRGLFRGADVLVLPAFSRLARGCVVNRMTTRDSLSPLVCDLDACRPVVVADGEPLAFPPLGELRSHL